MKRRDFLVTSAGLAGAVLPAWARGQTRPCPPSPVAAAGGESATSYCGASVEADWIARSTAPGVVWAHDFRSAAEVDAFRWSGGIGNDPNDVGRPNTVRRLTTDGVTGACLEIHRPAGSTDGAVWWRPFSPLVGTGNGKGVNDAAANGTLTVRAYNPTQGSSAIQNHAQGYYGHPSYHNANFDGTEYYFQMRLKMDPRRAAQASGGKLLYFTLCKKSATAQELVTESGECRGSKNYFSMYRSVSPPLETDIDPYLGHNQPGNENGFCNFTSQPANCWAHSGGWDTYMYRIKPGLDSGKDTVVQVWAAREGQTAYTKIWDMNNVDLPFETEFGHNALILSGYQNGYNFSTDVYHRYCQLIFSKSFIPCPQV